ncbi:MAG: hypothetical protein FWE80_06510 [Oscillospiraceae bacterium]|nr:hypothetical protein [Oscillospiraceae bacterium]
MTAFIAGVLLLIFLDTWGYSRGAKPKDMAVYYLLMGLVLTGAAVFSIFPELPSLTYMLLGWIK